MLLSCDNDIRLWITYSHKSTKLIFNLATHTTIQFLHMCHVTSNFKVIYSMHILYLVFRELSTSTPCWSMIISVVSVYLHMIIISIQRNMTFWWFHCIGNGEKTVWCTKDYASINRLQVSFCKYQVYLVPFI